MQVPTVQASAIIAGGGIGGLAAALALSRAGMACQVLEQAATFGEIGAGVQLGPNAMRRLQGLGLADALASVAAFPQQLQVRRAADGVLLGTLPLGDTAKARYGAPYATVHRADLHSALLTAVKNGNTTLHNHCAVDRYDTASDNGTVNNIRVTTRPHRDTSSATFEGDFLVGADGLRSTVRAQMLGDGAPRLAGQIVYRALVAQNDLPATQRSNHVTVWLGPHLHVVSYPVRGGDWLNVAAIVHGQWRNDDQTQSHNWNQAAHTQAVIAALRGMCPALNDLIHALPNWAAWNVYDRPTVSGPQAMAQDYVALLGDAAHPMRPYLAQGAGMAIEDAVALADALSNMLANVLANGLPPRLPTHAPPPANMIQTALADYAAKRWQRNAQVQARAQRNGAIFHATGAIAWARDASIRTLGARVLDVPWLYGG